MGRNAGILLQLLEQHLLRWSSTTVHSANVLKLCYYGKDFYLTQENWAVKPLNKTLTLEFVKAWKIRQNVDSTLVGWFDINFADWWMYQMLPM